MFGAFYVVNLILAVINDSFLNQSDHSSGQNKDGSRLNTDSNANDSVNESPANRKFYSEDDLGNSPGFSRKTSELFKKSSFRFQSSPGLDLARSGTGLNTNRVPDRARKNKVIGFFYHVVMSKWFMAISFTLIIINTVTLSLDSYPINKQRQNVLDVINIVLTIAFFIEMIFRIIGFGLKEYVRDRFNLFDSVIVIMGVVEVILVNFAGISIGLNVLTGFRLLRLFRLFKLARSWESLRLLIQIFVRAIPDIKNFLILVVLFIIISALLGQELFAYRVWVYNLSKLINIRNGNEPRLNFNSFFNGLILVFTLLTNEEWNLRMYEAMNSQGPAASLFYVTVLIIGNYILLKLFLAILLSDFEELSHNQHSKPSAVSKIIDF